MGHRYYTIRRFDPRVEAAFTCAGSMNDFQSFIEEKIDNPHNALNVVYDNTVDVNSLTNFIDERDDKSGSMAEVYEVNLRLRLCINDSSEFKALRKPLQAAITSWAEKCRVRGHRGWRLSAIKSMRLERSGADYLVYCNIILGKVALYNQNTAKITDPQKIATEDALNLNRYLTKHVFKTSLASMKVVYDGKVII